MEYEKLGNIRPGYQNPRRAVRPVGLVKDPTLVLKLYDMYIKGQSTPEPLIQDSRGFLEREISRGNIKPYIGMGFAILSKDMLNVARWDITFPIVLQNQLYVFNEGKLTTLSRLDISDEGSFCVWELGIVAHEKEAWKRFLASKRKEADKRRYLEDVIEGDL